MNNLQNAENIVLETLKEYNPVVKTSLKPIEAKQLTCVNAELMTKALARSGEHGKLYRLFMDEDLKLMFDEDLKSASIKNQKLAKIFFALSDYILMEKDFCNSIIEMACYSNKLLLRKKGEDMYADLIKNSKSLEGMLGNLEIDQNELLTEITSYENPIELLTNFLVEYHNTIEHDKLEDYEAELLLAIQEALKKFFPVYQSKVIKKNADFYNKVCKLIRV